MSAALALVEPEQAELEPLPDLILAVAQIEDLVSSARADVLDEIARRAEAQKLYEERANNADRARHFWILKVHAEAGLGVLSFDYPDLVQPAGSRSSYRVLASAFERGKLLDVCRDPGRGEFTATIRNLGYTYAPGKALGLHQRSVPWRVARQRALEMGKPLADVPLDPLYAKRRKRVASDASKRMFKVADSQRRLQQRDNAKLVAAAAKERYPSLAKPTNLLRQTLQALDDAQVGMSRRDRSEIDETFYHLHKALDRLAAMLRVEGLQ